MCSFLFFFFLPDRPTHLHEREGDGKGNILLGWPKGNYFQWPTEHDVVTRSPERGQMWENIAAALSSLKQPKFRVTASQELFEIGIDFKTKTKARR